MVCPNLHNSSPVENHGVVSEDILIVVSGQYHVIHPIAARPELFVYLVLSADRGNFALARMHMIEIESKLAF